MAKRKKSHQGLKLRTVSLLRYVRGPNFQAGLADRAAGKPPGNFESWEYEHGRAVANALIAQGLDPLSLSHTKLAGWLNRLFDDGTLIE